VLLLDLLSLPEKIVVQSIVLRSASFGLRLPFLAAGLLLALVLRPVWLLVGTVIRLYGLVWRATVFSIRTLVNAWLRPWLLLFRLTWLVWRVCWWLFRSVFLR
jgi:hypothetical protein